MYKILIVDDEYYAREGIREMIRQIGSSFEVTGESPDAYHALELMERQCPDIVLADINMPVMNGIEFAKEAIKKNRRVKFIIITGHDEFEYAKQAFKLNIIDFILKPIDRDEVAEALARAVSYIKRDRLAVKKVLTEYLRGEEIEQQLAGWLPEAQYRLVLFDFGRKGTTTADEYIKISDWLKEEITGYTKNEYCTLQLQSDRVAGLISAGCENTMVFLTELSRRLDEKFHCSFTFALGQFKVEELSHDYGLVKQLLSEAFYYGDKHIIQTMFQAGRPVDEEAVKKQIEAIKIAAQACDKKTVQLKTKKLFWLFRRMKLDRHLILEYVVNLTLFVQTLLEGEQLSRQPAEKKYTTQGLTLEEIEQYIQKLLQIAVIQLRDNKSDTENNAVKRAVTIINSRYCENLSLDQLAREVFLNSSYLSRKLKEQLGLSYIKYITKLRMEKAVELLKDNSNVEQVAKAVGYGNYKHFSDVFKNYTGYLPSIYKKGMDDK